MNKLVFYTTTFVSLGSQFFMTYLGTLMGIPLSSGSFIVSFIFSMLGVFLSASENKMIKLLGTSILSISIGIILGSLEINNLTGIIMVMAGIVGTMSLVAYTTNWFEKIGGALFVSLIALVLVNIISLLLGYHFGVLHYVSLGLFSLYFGYDMHQTFNIEKTFNNAIDCSINLYLDLINIFTSLIGINNED